MIAILGMGLLGANFTRALIERGETVHVWNRTPERATALEAEGAVAFASAADAVRGAERVHIVVSDDAAVDSVLDLAQCAPGTLVIDHTTTSTRGALDRTARADIVYVHAPVFMGPQNAREATGLMLVSGDRDRVARVRPILETMTGTLLDMGARVDAARRSGSAHHARRGTPHSPVVAGRARTVTLPVRRAWPDDGGT